MNWNYGRFGQQGIEKFGEYQALLYQEENFEKRLTNVEIHKQSNAFANGLGKLGIKRGEIVAVVLPNGPEVPVVFTGIFKLGAVFLPVIFGLSAREINFILKDSNPAAIVTNGELLPKIREALEGLNRPEIIIAGSNVPETISFDSLLYENPVSFDIADMGPDDLAVLMYTSGTTGFPKGVMLSHRNISKNLENGLELWPTDENDLYLVPLPLNHIYGMLMVNECNLTGARLVMHKWFDPKLVLNSITRHGVTQFVGVPTMYIKLLEAHDPTFHDTSTVRRWLSAAAPLSIETLHAVEEKLGGRLYQGYGMTEAAPTITRQKEGRARKPGSVGIAINDMEIKIADGEICVRGPSVMLGYLNREEETREALKDGWLYTGDMGYLDEEGDLFITDRKKDIIIRGGENISPAAIEGILFQHDAVKEAAVIGVPDPVYGEEVKAFVALKPGTSASEKELIDHCLEHIPRFKAPKTITFLDELPKSAVGKILKKELSKKQG